ncbi:MAG: phosphate transport system substrate-binding protein [Mycobacterium sp.]|nr:phosphate transport system substrate-binding protein [Mycobacterium sp.]
MTVIAAAVTACGSDDNRGASTPISGSPSGGASCGGKSELTAEGSTAQQNAIALFNRAWSQSCPGKKVAYNATGSGAGRAQFIANHVDFAGTDAPLVAAEIDPAAQRCNGNAAWDLPLVFDPIALVYNLTGLSKLIVNADALAKIFSGGIRMWNDPALLALNPGAALPNTKIVPIYRKDSSGTTDNFQRYMNVAAPLSWTRGVGSEFQGGVGEGAQRSAGVIQAVQATPGAIGYVDKGLADRAGVPYGQIDTGNGVVPLTDQTARNAVNAVTFAAGGNDLILELDSMYGAQDPTSYPLVLASYEIVCSQGYDSETAAAVKGFLSTAVNSGQTALTSAGYVRLPDKVKERLVAAINALQ